jgi:hypothetical protein
MSAFRARLCCPAWRSLFAILGTEAAWMIVPAGGNGKSNTELLKAAGLFAVWLTGASLIARWIVN